VADLAREFNRMASQIETLIANQNRLVGDISHELGSPLARLRLAVSLARKQLGCTAQAPLDRIDRESERLDELTRQLLQLIRIDSPNVELARVRIPLDEFVEDVARDCNFEACSMGRSIRLDRIWKCEADVYPDLLRSALENVIRNGIRYTAENTAVHIDMLDSEWESAVRILIRDHGPGVREECLPHLFEPFYRAEPARDRKSGGVGLGLSIAHRAVERHAGAIQARNSSEGGLEVEISLPVVYDKSLHF
jgi:signal transduction histidine kinase